MEMLTRQEFFDRSVAHLRKQGSPAKHDDMECAYRTADGKKCAIGCMIAYEDYDPSLEGRAVLAVARLDKPLLPIRRTNRNILFLMALQKAHDDNVMFHDWEGRLERSLKKVAKDFNLDYKPVDSGSPAGA